VDTFHTRLARVGLAAAERYGFALAGGYAVQAAGLVQRPSEDVDLFTAWERRGEFDVAVAAVVDAYRADGLQVRVQRQYDTFARLDVSDSEHASKVELGVDWRANEPIHMSIGSVLHPDDAVATPVLVDSLPSYRGNFNHRNDSPSFLRTPLEPAHNGSTGVRQRVSRRL
jgi:hypothetical protein